MPRPFANADPRLLPMRAPGAPSAPLGLVPPPADSPATVQLRRILNSQVFAGAHRSRLLLRYIVEHALTHPDDPPKEYSIAFDVFHRGAYDPAVNNAVRVEVGRLRSRLLEYYAGEGRSDPLRIEIPKGAYRAVLRSRPPAPAPAARQIVPATAAPSLTPRLHSHFAVAAAFLLGAFLGYRASH